MEKRKHSVVTVISLTDVILTIFSNGSKEKGYRFSNKTDAGVAQKLFEEMLIGEGYEKDDGEHHFIKQS